MELRGKKVLLGFSGGPDAAALAYHLKKNGANVAPVYIDYRKTSGGKTAKDLRHAKTSATALGLKLHVVRAPLGKIPKKDRNKHFVEVLSRAAAADLDAEVVALGTIRENDDDDLDPDVFSCLALAYGPQIITWDSFDVKEKAGEFEGIPADERGFLFATTSCQMWWKKECGRCHSCAARHAAFLEAFGYDPTEYIHPPKTARQ